MPRSTKNRFEEYFSGYPIFQTPFVTRVAIRYLKQSTLIGILEVFCHVGKWQPQLHSPAPRHVLHIPNTGELCVLWLSLYRAHGRGTCRVAPALSCIFTVRDTHETLRSQTHDTGNVKQVAMCLRSPSGARLSFTGKLDVFTLYRIAV
jgi:hypothetical protein